MINVQADFSDLLTTLDNQQRNQIPFAASQAINDVAFKAVKQLKADAQVHLDRPTPFTLRAFKVEKATKKKLRGYVYVDRIQESYLQFQIEGGVRRDKQIGRVLVPVNARLNAYGNIPGKRTGPAKQTSRFIAERNGIHGVWQRSGRKRKSIQLVARYHDTATYKEIFPFHRIVRGIVVYNINKEFEKRLAFALRTAR